VTRFLLVFGVLMALGAAPALAEPDAVLVPPASELEAGSDGITPEGGGAGTGVVEQNFDDAKRIDAQPAAPAKKPAYLDENSPFPLRDYEEPKPTAQAPWWQQALGFVFKLLLVIGLVFVSLGIIKKLSGGRVMLPNAKGRNMVVLETTNLGPQSAVHLISLGGERLLVVGTGPQGVTKLAEIDDPAQVRPFLNSSRTNPSSFNQVFDLENAGHDHGPDLFAQPINQVGLRSKDWG
jgi:flagellar biogenesis protein FliO